MASEFAVGLKLGVIGGASVVATLAGTRRALTGLTTVTRALEIQQKRLGRTMSVDFARGGRDLARQRADYDRLGRAIGRVGQAHKSLASAAARSKGALASSRRLWIELGSTAAAAWGTTKSIMATAGKAATFQDTLRNTRITGGLSAADEQALGAAIRAAIGSTNQSREELASGAHQMVADGMSVGDVGAQLELFGTTMTALRTSSETTSGAMLALRNMGVQDAAGMQRALDTIVAIGGRGSFTAEMMVSAFAKLGDTIKQTGLKGDTAIAELAAGLQIAEGTMGAESAQAGLQGWLSSMNDPKIAAGYERVGVNYAASMAKMQAQGLSQYQAGIELASGFLRDRLGKKDMQALLGGSDDARITDMLGQLGLGEVFKDANAARFALSVSQNRDKYKDMTATSGDGSLASVHALRLGSPTEQLKTLSLSIKDLAIDIGTDLLPMLLEGAQALKPIVAGIREFTQANPVLIKTIAAAAVGMVGIRVASIAVKFAFSSIRIPLTQVALGFRVLRAAGVLAQAQWLIMLPKLRLLSGALLGKVGAVTKLAGVLGGQLLAGLRVAGQAVLWLGRALVMNPIGIAVMAIAGAAFLVYKYWEPISGFFKDLWQTATGAFDSAAQWISTTAAGLWDKVENVFSGGLGSIGEMLLNWSPLGLLYNAITGSLAALGIELPEKFSDFGGMILRGLVSGITGMLSSARDSISGMGDSVVGWFKNKLGIKSPSTVFMTLGGHVSEGAALGIAGGQHLVRDAALGLATATAVTLAPPVWGDVPEVPAAFTQAGAAAGGAMVVNFSPTIQVNGSSNVRDQVDQALQIGFVEFERMMRQYEARNRRRSYGDI